MKFLVDAQLPKSLSNLLSEKGFDTIHTINLADKNKTTDRQIIDIAEIEKRIVVTKDYDFLDSFLLGKGPQKLILIRTGNIHNKELLKIFENQITIIVQMLEQNSLIEIYSDEIIVHASK